LWTILEPEGTMERSQLERTISAAYEDRSRLTDPAVKEAVEVVIRALDRGELRVADREGGEWRVNAWIKEAILLYFALRPLEPMEAGGLHFYDKIATKQNLVEQGIRVVPPGVARYGSFLEPGCVLMPGYVNIGAYVGEGTMVDTWATVGSCAQIGRGVHLSGGVGIGGVLEPPGASPVIIEDGAFVGSRSIVVEGVVVEEEAVLGANVVLTASTPIIDVTGPHPRTTRGRVPARSVVIPGTQPKAFPAGEFHVPCALIIGERKESTDRKTSLNDVLRTFDVQV
jgi:2,3,4,5-tetrahydropyridine-2,6-dicarboxylate N-succinyltransferase